MIDAILGPHSILPYNGRQYVSLTAWRVMLRRTRSRTRSLPQWAYAVTLFVSGVSLAQASSILTSRPAMLAPVTVLADRAEWGRALRRDTVTRMLVKMRVDSATATQWAHDFVYYGEQVNINPKLLVAIAYAESEFNPRAYSSAGAVGLMQVLPVREWWLDYERLCGHMSEQSLHDPRTNICFGAYIFKEFLVRHRGNTARALAAYNNGSGVMNGYPRRVYLSWAALR